MKIIYIFNLMLILPCVVFSQIGGPGEPCRSGDCKNGEGIKVYDNKDVYEGEFRNYKRHGQGVYTFFNSGNGMRGEWKDGQLDGYGERFDYAGRVTQRGYWVKGEYKGRNNPISSKKRKPKQTEEVCIRKSKIQIK